MAHITPLPTYNFAGNIPDLVISDVSGRVPFTLAIDDRTIVSEIYDAIDGQVVVRLKDILENSAICPAVTEASAPLVKYKYSTTLDAFQSGTFYCLKGGLGVETSIETYLKGNFLTWQPQTRRTLYHTPQYLRYVALMNCTCRAKAYFSDKTTATVDLLAGMTAGNIYTIDTSFGSVRGKFSKQPLYFDVWVESAGIAKTWTQRYMLVDAVPQASDFFLFENSLGGFDTICFSGDRREIDKLESASAKFDEDTIEYDIPAREKSFKKYTGYFEDDRTRLWALDFFNSTTRYHLSDGVLKRIYVSEPKLEIDNNTLGGYEFTFAHSAQTKYLNFPRVDVPELLEIVDPAEELFFLAPRLNQFQLAELTDDVLIPVQRTNSNKWFALPAVLIKTMIDGIGTVIEGLTEIFHPKGGRPELDIEARNVSAKETVQSKKLAVADSATIQKLVASLFQTPGFIQGLFGGGIGTVDGEELQADKLLVRKTMTVIDLLIQKVRYIGGQQIASSASMKVSRVVDGGSYWDCFFETDAGQIKNEFVVSDQARLQTFSTTTRYLWALVTAVGQDYVRLSKTDKEGGSAPQAGDDLVQLGHRTDPDRQSAVIISAAGGEIGVVTYAGISSFSLTGKEQSWFGRHNGKTGARFVGEIALTTGQSVQDYTRQQIDSSVPGTRNLALKTAGRLDFSTTSWAGLYLSLAEQPVIGQQYILSWDDVQFTDTSFPRAWLWIDSFTGMVSIANITKPGPGSAVVTIPDTLLTNQTYRILFGGSNGPMSGYVTNPKWSVGNKKTAWEPAYEDIANASNEYADQAVAGVQSSSVNLIDGSRQISVVATNSNTAAQVPIRVPLKKGETLALSVQNVEILAGSPQVFSAMLWNKTGTQHYSDEIQMSADNLTGIFTVLQDSAEDLRLFLYAGKRVQTTGNSVVYNETMLVRGNRPALSWTPSPADQDKKAQQYAGAGKIFVRGTSAARWYSTVLILNDDGADLWKNVTASGVYLTILRRTDLSVVETITYSKTWDAASQSVVDALAAKLNGLSDDVIVCMGSEDSFYGDADYTALSAALARCGGSGKKMEWRVPYALVGIPGIGKGAGIEVFTSKSPEAPYAEISTQVSNGIPAGINTATLPGIESAQATADKAQTAAAEAKTGAAAANAKLSDWASDALISPPEKPGLLQQKADITAEYSETGSQADRYALKSSAEWIAYSGAYTLAVAALAKYTAATPENIPVGADYGNIAAYYPKRQSMLDRIAAAAKSYADEVVAAVQPGSDNLMLGTQHPDPANASIWNNTMGAGVWGEVGDFTAVRVRTQWGRLWQGISGGFKAGAEYHFSCWIRRDASLETAETKGQLTAASTIGIVRAKLDGTLLGTGGAAGVMSGNSLAGIALATDRFQRLECVFRPSQDTSGTNFRLEFYTSAYQTTMPCGVVYGYYLVKGDRATDDWRPAIKDLQAATAAAQTTADNALTTGLAASQRLTDWASDQVISPPEKPGLIQQKADISAEYSETGSQADRYVLKSSAEWIAYSGAYTLAVAALAKYTAATPENIPVGSDYGSIAAYYPKRQSMLDRIAAAAKSYADEVVDAVQVGTVNLIDDSERIAAVAAADNNYSFTSRPVRIRPGGELSLSVDRIEVLSGNPSGFSVNLMNKTFDKYFGSATITKDARTAVYKIADSVEEQDGYILFYAGKMAYTGGVSVNYHKVMLVPGNRPALGWTPSPADVKGSVDDIYEKARATGIYLKENRVDVVAERFTVSSPAGERIMRASADGNRVEMQNVDVREGGTIGPVEITESGLVVKDAGSADLKTVVSNEEFGSLPAALAGGVTTTVSLLNPTVSQDGKLDLGTFTTTDTKPRVLTVSGIYSVKSGPASGRIYMAKQEGSAWVNLGFEFMSFASAIAKQSTFGKSVVVTTKGSFKIVFEAFVGAGTVSLSNMNGTLKDQAKRMELRPSSIFGTLSSTQYFMLGREKPSPSASEIFRAKIKNVNGGIEVTSTGVGIEGETYMAGQATVNGSFGVTGLSSMKDIEGDNATFSRNLSVWGNAKIDGTLTGGYPISVNPAPAQGATYQIDASTVYIDANNAASCYYNLPLNPPKNRIVYIRQMHAGFMVRSATGQPKIHYSGGVITELWYDSFSGEVKVRYNGQYWLINS